MLREALQYRNNVASLLWRFTHNNADVDDLLQEVWLRLSKVKEHPNPKALALSIAFNVATDLLRRQASRRTDFIGPTWQLETVSMEQTLGEVISFEREIEADSELQRVVAAVMKLPKREREVFALRKVYGFSPWEIVRHTRLSIGQVETALTGALRALSGALGQQLPAKERPMRNRLRRRRAG